MTTFKKYELFSDALTVVTVPSEGEKLTTAAHRMVDVYDKAMMKIIVESGTIHGGKIKDDWIQFEGGVDAAWDKAYKKHNVDHVYKLPIEVWKKVVEKNIAQPLIRIIRQYTALAANYSTAQEYTQESSARKNPYIRAVAVLTSKYGASLEDKETK